MMNCTEMNKLFLFLFLLAATVNLVTITTDWPTWAFYSKILLMPSLVGFFLLSTQGIHNLFKKYITAGLVFSWLGDICLLFDNHPIHGQIYFLSGLASFLTAHICYTLAFLKIQAFNKGNWPQPRWVIAAYGLYLIFLLYTLWPGVPPSMKGPVMAYGIVITVMSLACFNLRTKLSAELFWPLFAGSLFFITSDSILAISLFGNKGLTLPASSVLVMLTYIIAQYLIATTCTKISNFYS